MTWPVAPGVVRGERIATSNGIVPATLHLAGVEPFPVTSDGDPSTKALIELLSS